MGRDVKETLEGLVAYLRNSRILMCKMLARDRHNNKT